MTSNRGGTEAGQPAREAGKASCRRGVRARRIAILTGAIVLCAVVGTLAFALRLDSSDAATEGVVAAAAIAPAPKVIAAATEEPLTTDTAGPTLSPSPQPTDAATAAPTLAPRSSSVTVTPTIDGAWSATPFVATPAPSPSGFAPAPAVLAESLESRYGVRILTAGQDWGSDDATRLRNIGAVGAALAGVPASVRSAVAANPGGALTFLSNDSGSTEAGWQPYGNRQANYYSNEDVVTGTHVAANQIVLQPGSTAQTIAHEVMHAFQLRAEAPGDFAAALLTPEMKSFMQATGWTQIVPDDQVRADAGSSWEAVDADFTYTGRTLTYEGADSSMLSLFAPNPVEAYAEAGGIYYAHSATTTLPDWPEYWGWFSANVG